jgi:eukaryotic-like serine/threonine-protein kinase
VTAGSFPQRFGKFLLTSPLAHGGMSHLLLGKADGVYGYRRLVAIKRMLPVLSQDPGFVRLFLEEARLGALLQHRNVVQVFEYGQVDEQLYLAMEYVDGLDLRVLMTRARHDQVAIPLGLCLYIVEEVCRGLDFVHRQRDERGQPLGIVHRDVSPSNVLLSRDGAVKICDLGIATVVRQAPTVSEQRAGKFSYMSPEQAAGQPLDLRSDLFSVGILLWEMIAGRRLYGADSDAATLEKARRAEVPTLDLEGLLERGRLAAVLERALAREPAGRYPSARELRQALHEYEYAAGVQGSAELLALFLEATCPGELRRRGQRRDAQPVDSELTPGTPLPGAVPAVRPPLRHDSSRALIPYGARESVSVPEQFPEVVSEPVVETPLIVSRPHDGPGQIERTPVPDRQRPPSKEDRLVEHLRTQGQLTSADIERALAHAQREHTSLTRGLIDLHIVSESCLCHALSEVHGLPTVDLSTWSLPGSLASLVPLSLAQARALVPFRQENAHGRTAICIAVTDPEARSALAEIEALTGVRTKVFLARASAIAAAIDFIYRGISRPIPALYPKGMAEPGV